MKIFIAGGTGRVATALTKRLLADGHEVIAGARHPENIKFRDNTNVTAVTLDLTAAVSEIAQIIGQVDVIYFTAGSRGKNLLQIDAFGAVKVMQAAKQNGTTRFIMLSSLHALQPEKWHEGSLSQITDYNIAKFFADNYLMTATALDYTILQPTVLVEAPALGKIKTSDVHVASNPIDDVAQVLADVLKFPNTSHQVIEMASGATDIDAALSKI